MSFLKKKNILITGGTGSFGNALINRLIKEKNFKTITVFSRDENKQHHMRIKLNNSKIKFIIGDIRDQEATGKALKDINIVFHAAALKHVPTCELYPSEAISTNVLGTKNIINLCEKNDIEKLIILSTDKAVYPINAMGMTKALAEKLVISSRKNSNTKIMIVRYGNVVHSRGSVVETFINQIKNNSKYLTVTNKDMTRFLLSLDDAIDLVIFALKKTKHGTTFVKKAPSARIMDIALACKELFKSNIKIKETGIREGEKLHETLVSKEEMISAKNLKDFFTIDNFKNKNVSNFIYKGKANGKYYEYSSNNQKLLNKKEIINLFKKIRTIKEMN